MMSETFGYQLRACGKKGMPQKIACADGAYRLSKVLKHDFFAATGLYELDGPGQSSDTPAPPKVILKLSRQQHFLGVPLQWLGRIICSHELTNLRRLQRISGVPSLLSDYGKTGFIYVYIEGCSLDETKKIPPRFFDELLELLQKIHQCNIAYLDMNKRGNILLAPDGTPRLIDFQISLHIGSRFLISRRLSTYLRNALQRADLYHLFKHKRKFQPELLTPQERTLSRTDSRLIRLHRLAATPLRKLRRSLLKFLHLKGMVVTDEKGSYTPENDPNRFSK